MKCDSEVRFGVRGIFLPLKWLFVNSETGVLVSKIWSGLTFYIKGIPKISMIVSLAFLGVMLQGMAWGQTTVFSDDFTSNNSTNWTQSGAIGASQWSITKSADYWAGRIANTRLELTNERRTDRTPTNGWVMASTPSSSFTCPYNTTLSSSGGLVTWTFNMRSPLADGSLEGCSDQSGSWSYGIAFLLAGTSNFNNNSGTGYAVVLGQSGNSDYVRLVRCSNGMLTTTDIITGNTDLGSQYLSIKITYNPSNNSWELFVRNDGTSAFTDPETGSLTSQGTATNNTYTGTSLTLMGTYWQGSTATTNNEAYFDNINVKVSSTPPTITCPSNITANATSGTCGATVTYTLPTWTDNCSQSAPSGFGAVQYNPANGHYYALSTGTATWAAADAACRAVGGHLATIANAAENAFVLSKNGGNSVWIGLTDQASEGNFVWVTGESDTYRNWNGGEPNNAGGGEDYTELTTGGGWNDLNSSATNRYMIELGVSVLQTEGLPSGSTFPVGTTTNTFVATNASGNTVTCSFTVTVNIPAPTPVTTIPSTICTGASSNLNATSAGYTIRWYTVSTGGSNIGTSASGANFAVSPSATTIYYAEAYNAGGGCTSATRTPVTVTVNSLPTFSVEQTNVSCYGGNDGSIKFTILSGPANYEFTINGVSGWTAPQVSGVKTFGGLNVADGPYNIAVRDGNGCVQTVPTLP